jgi:hypothetical protein
VDGIGTDITGADLHVRESKGTLTSPTQDIVTPQVAAPAAAPAPGAFLPALYHAHNRYNAFVSIPRAMNALFGAMDNTPVEGYNPFKDLDEKYAPYHSLIGDVESPEERAGVLRYIDYKAEEERIANSNIYANLIGTGVGAVATTLPTLPLGEMMWAANSIPALAFRGAVVGAVIDVPIEAALVATDPGFEMDEVWTGIAWSAVLGGVFEPIVAGSHAAVKSADNLAPTPSTGTISAPAVSTAVTPALKKEVYAAVQAAEDGFKPSVRLTKSGEMTPEAYLAAKEAEGLAPATGPLAPVFNLFTKTAGNKFQPSLAARLLESDSTVVRELTNSISEHNFLLNKTAQGKTLGISAESQIEANTVRSVTMLEDAVDNGYAAYKKAGGTGNINDFQALASRAARRGDYSQPGVGETARAWSQMMSDYLEKYKKVDLFQDVSTALKDGSKYFTRLYDRDKIVQNIGEFRKTISEHIAPTIEKEMLAENPLASAQSIKSAVDKAVEDVRSNIMGNNYFDLEHLTWSDRNGKARTIDLPDLVLEPWLSDDIKQIGRMYIGRAEKDLAFQERFGTASKTKILQNVADDYKGLIEKSTSPTEIARLESRLKEDLSTLEIIIDRLQGTRGQPKDPSSLSSTAFKAIMPYNMARGLGSIALTQMPELVRANIQRFIVSSGIESELKSLGVAIDNMKLTKAEAKSLGAYLEHGQRVIQMYQGEPIMHNMIKKEGRFVAGLQAASEATAKYSGMGWMDNTTRGLLAESAVRDISGYIKAAEKGKLTAKGRLRLNELGISEDLLPEIKTMMAKHSETIDGFTYANIDKWEGAAGDAMRAAIRKDFQKHIVRPGAADRFGFADVNNTARLAMQFRSYFQAAWSRTLLPGMQRADSAFLGTMAGLVMTGYVVMKLKNMLAGRDQELTTAQTITESINASGAVPFLFDLYSTGNNAFFGGGTQRQVSQGRLDTLFGPTAGLIGNAPPALTRTLTGNMTPGDTKTIKSMIPFNNLVWWNWYTSQLQKDKAAEIKRRQEFNKSGGSQEAVWDVSSANWRGRSRRSDDERAAELREEFGFTSKNDQVVLRQEDLLYARANARDADGKMSEKEYDKVLKEETRKLNAMPDSAFILTKPSGVVGEVLINEEGYTDDKQIKIADRDQEINSIMAKVPGIKEQIEICRIQDSQTKGGNAACEFTVPIAGQIYSPNILYRIFGIKPSMVRAAMKAVDAADENDHIELLIDSVGGSVETLNMIRDVLKESKAEVVATIPRQAMSAGLSLAMLAREIRIDPDATVLWHSMGPVGNVGDQVDEWLPILKKQGYLTGKELELQRKGEEVGDYFEVWKTGQQWANEHPGKIKTYKLVLMNKGQSLAQFYVKDKSNNKGE